MWVLCDLDGTLADHKHRLEHAHKMEWDQYNIKAALDPVVDPVRKVIKLFCGYGYNIGLVTARPDNNRQLTERWLHNHGVPYNVLLMRSFGDWRTDHEVKLEMALANFKVEDVLFVMDDRQAVTQAWRDNGFTCFQVAADLMPGGWTP